MKIFPVNNKYYFNTKSYSINFKTCPIFFDETPKEDEFVKSDDSIDIERIKKLNINHFRLINQNSIRGATLSNQSPNVLSTLQECGIDTIIDLRTVEKNNTKYAEFCKENGLKYFNFKLKLNMPIFQTSSSQDFKCDAQNENENFIKKLPKFFNIMNKGNFYLACLLGLHRTDFAVTLNYLLNPKEPQNIPILSHMIYEGETNYTSKYILAAKNLLNHLNPKNKNSLSIPNNFNDIFEERVIKLKAKNGIK